MGCIPFKQDPQASGDFHGRADLWLDILSSFHAYALISSAIMKQILLMAAESSALNAGGVKYTSNRLFWKVEQAAFFHSVANFPPVLS